MDRSGKGHGTDKAVMLGLLGEAPETVEPDRVTSLIAAIEADETFRLLGESDLPFEPKREETVRGGVAVNIIEC